MKVRLVVVGAGGHARVVADAADASGRYESITFVDDRWPEIKSADGHAVVGNLAMLLADRDHGGRAVIVGIGHNATRDRILQQLADAGHTLATVVHPSAVVSALAHVGDGVLVGAAAVINAGARVERGAIVNTGAIVEHDCRIGESCHVCPGTRLAGNVTLGAACWIGIGATVIQGLSVGDHAVVGAGAVVIRDVAPRSVVAGCPAKPL